MPSGAKKRKAAKKKKENKPNSSNIATHSQGENGKKNHDEKESDASGHSSPMSQGHQHSFTDGEEGDVEKRESTSSVRSFATENNSAVGVDHNNGGSRKNVAVEEGGVVQRENHLKPKDKFEIKNVSIDKNGESRKNVAMEGGNVVQRDDKLKPKDNFESKNVSIEYVEPVRDSRNGHSSSSRSDAEPRVVDKNVVVVESKESTDKGSNSVVKSGASVNSVKQVDSSSEVVPQVVGGVPVSKANNTVVESAPIAATDKVSFSQEAVRGAESAPVESYVTSNVVVGENGKEMLSLETKDSEVPSVVMGSWNKEVSTSDEKAAASSDGLGFAAQDNKGKLLSVNTPGVDTGRGAEHIKTSEGPECSESQPLVDSAPRVVQATSWKSCCGLFEVFTGSSR